MNPRLLVVCLLLALPLSARAADPFRKSVVRLHATHRAPEMMRPWTKSVPSQVTGSGAVIDGGRILTNAHVVNYSSQVFVQLQKGGDQLPAKVVAIGPRIDLAVVELEDPTPLEGIPPLSLADSLPNIKSTVNVYGYPMGGEDLSVTEGIVSRIDFSAYYYDGAGVRVQVDAALNSGNSGGPALQEGEIIGLVFSGILQAENIGYLIPAEEIRAFLDDVADGSFEGKPRLFDRYNTAENAALRDYLKLKDDDTGVVVAQPYRDTEDYPLKTWDVVTHIGSHNIDNQGYVEVSDELKLRFEYYLASLEHDGKVPLTIQRDGKIQEIQLPVEPTRDLLMPTLRTEYPRYLIHGPICFTVATQEYLRSAGAAVFMALSRYESPLVNRLFDAPAFEGEELVIIGSRLFPHRITKGYSTSPYGVVSHFNEMPVQNLRHLAELLRDNREEYCKFTLDGVGESLVFRADEMEAATEDILSDEGIRFRSSEDLRDVWPE